MPAHNPVAVAAVCIGDVFHVYKYPGVPPVAITLAKPLQDEQDAFPKLEILQFTVEAGSVMVVFFDCVHPFKSVIVTVYVAGARLVAHEFVAPLLQLKLKGALPPVIPLAQAVPLLAPKQLTFVFVILKFVIGVPGLTI